MYKLLVTTLSPRVSRVTDPLADVVVIEYGAKPLAERAAEIIESQKLEGAGYTQTVLRLY
jgi:hypothetical protein